MSRLNWDNPRNTRPYATHHADPDELLGVVEAGLQQLGQIVVLCGADESGDGEAVDGARAGVQVGQQHAERVAVELDHVELKGKWEMILSCCRKEENENRSSFPRQNYSAAGKETEQICAKERGLCCMISSSLLTQAARGRVHAT